MNIPSDMTPLSIDLQQVEALMAYLRVTTRGPREAYGLLCITILRLNSELDEPKSIDALVEEMGISLRSAMPTGVGHA